MNTKQCRKCEEVKPATTEYFGIAKENRDGLMGQCKVCRSIEKRIHEATNKEHYVAYRQANKQRQNERRRAWREANKERLREQDRAYDVTNKEHIAKRKRAYHMANREQLAKRQRAYHRANRNISRATTNRHRARKLNAVGSHTASDIKRQYEAQKGLCHYCACDVKDAYEVDHVIPMTRGGTNGPENIVIACKSCNRSKNNKLPHEWARGGRLL